MKRRTSLARNLTEPGKTKYAHPGKGRVRQRLRTDPDSVSTKEIKANMDYKSQRDNLGHLRGFLRAHVGEQWDTVYSKLVRRLSGDGKLHRHHVLSHLGYWVEKSPIIMNGKVYRHWGYGGLVEFDNGFYVDPESGKLCFEPKRVTKTVKKPIEEVTDGQTVFRYQNGFWFRFEPTGRQVLRMDPKTGLSKYVEERDKTQMSREDMNVLYARYPGVRRDLGGSIS